MKKYVSRSEAAKIKGVTPQRIYQMIKEGKLEEKNDGIDAKSLYLTGNKILDEQFRKLPEDKRKAALIKQGYIEQFKKFKADYIKQNGQPQNEAEALARYCHIQGLAVRSLQRWMAQYKAAGGDSMSLVDGRGDRSRASISPGAWEHFKSLYLTQQQLSAKLCWLMTKYVNDKESRDWQIPSLRRMQQLAAAIPESVQVLHREGMEAYQAQCCPHIQPDLSKIEPGEYWVGDHHQCNCWIRYRGRWVRPWITAWQDMRSRLSVGRDFNAGPNQTTILIAFKRAVERYGPPRSVKIDNGKDYDSELFTGTTKQRRRQLNRGYIDEMWVAGLYAMMDITISLAQPYHPQAKAIERWFDTFDNQFCKTLPTYCGKDIARRPEELVDYLKSDKAIAEAMNLEEFARRANEWVETIYNRRPHNGAGMDNQSPLAVMKQRRSRRVLGEGILELLCRVWSGKLRVGKNGVRFKEMWYGQYDAELLIRQGREVRLAYDPDDLRRVWIYDAATMQLITIAEQNQLVAYGAAVAEEDLREGLRQRARATKIVKSFRNASLTKNMDLPSLALRAQQEGLKDEPPPETATAHLQPVLTLLDGQVAEHQRQQLKQNLKKASGAEGLQNEPLEFDLEKLKPNNPYDGLNLFDEG